MTLDNKVIVLTGATGGIGTAVTRRYCQLGASLVASDIDEVGGLELEKTLRDEGYDVTFVAGDVTQSSTARAIAEVVTERHGRLDVLHNNAGVLIGKGVLDTTDEEWDLMINVSLRGTFLMTRGWCR
ncbi:SDR family NAD(P)-dependent oxidoreductase [Aeromicrobium sp. UC242_57]|uniref:SDR family NAD(P)-dependent oxidoreductase n=1 Tax=Aeromicrobium sp. UC242_57 TaxID=3374624 RepID=UPI0037A0F61C